MSYADDLYGNTQSRDHDINTDPSLQNTFWAVFQTSIYLYLRSAGRNFWPIFSK